MRNCTLHTDDITLIPPPTNSPPFLADIGVRSNIGLLGKSFKNAISHSNSPRTFLSEKNAQGGGELN